jgi:hypothetical protein
MSDQNKNDAYPPFCTAEHWARALGLSEERLLAIVKEVVEERRASPRKRRLAQPTQ